MIVTIKLENQRPSDGHHSGGRYWVSRTNDRVWHSYAKEHFATTPGEAAAAMYHACEIESVTESGNKATVRIGT